MGREGGKRVEERRGGKEGQDELQTWRGGGREGGGGKRGEEVKEGVTEGEDEEQREG